VIQFDVEVRTHSQNRYHRGSHWGARKATVDEHRLATRRATVDTPGWSNPELPIVVTLTRLAFNELDDDNLPSSMKSIRDELAKVLGVDDRDRRITWRYAQTKAPPKHYSVRVRIEPREAA
jgi:hypothetical protein